MLPVKEMIALYSPIVVTVLGYITTFCVLVKKLRSISFKDETKALEKKVDIVIEENKALRVENAHLKKQLSLLIDKEYKVKDYKSKGE